MHVILCIIAAVEANEDPRSEPSVLDAIDSK
jgi:hypothetical protein